MEYKIVSSIGALAVLIVVLVPFLSTSDYKEFVNNPANPPVGIFQFDDGKTEIVTKTPGCDYGLFRIEGNNIKIKCGWRVAADFDVLTEYFTTWGEDKWLRNDKKKT
ncbi:MAG: hypothetical protein KAK00_11095, partial [Nanoarchaeota archaeon]|nr:hypothetical protein [Nanoarchaeota archaeon]